MWFKFTTEKYVMFLYQVTEFIICNLKLQQQQQQQSNFLLKLLSKSITNHPKTSKTKLGFKRSKESCRLVQGRQGVWGN
jgi:hypothetical protein